MHILSVALTHAYAHGKALGIVGEWTYGTHQGCRHGWGLACYFEPHAAQCPHLFSREPDDATLTRMLREEEPHWMWEHRDSVSGVGQCSHYRPNVADNPAWSFRQQGLLWWRSHILSFLMNPNTVLQRRVRHVKNLIGYTHPIIGLHIRHGDACTHASLSNYRPGCKSVADYFAEVVKMGEKYDVSKVFLATDDDSVLQYIRAVYRDWDVVHLNLDRSEFHSNWFIEYRMKASLDAADSNLIDLELVADSTVLDLMLLSESDYFVGGFSSHFSRLVLELSVANKGYVPPYVSLDLSYGMPGQTPPYAQKQ